jgi:hypothetical protein
MHGSQGIVVARRPGDFMLRCLDEGLWTRPLDWTDQAKGFLCHARPSFEVQHAPQIDPYEPD